MKIAVTYENGQVFQHFGHAQQFKLYTVDGGKILSREVVSSNGSGHGALAGMLSELGVNVLICGGIGMGAQLALDDAGIELYAGCSGEADLAVAKLLAGVLPHNGQANCNHHHYEHGQECSCGHDHGHDHHHEHGHECHCHDHH